MKYSRVCQNCLAKSDEAEEICPDCGTAKHLRLRHSSIYGSLIKHLANKIPGIDNAEFYVGYVINSLLMLLGILIINPLTDYSRLLWIFLLLYFIRGVVKETSTRVGGLRKLYPLTRILVFIYTGAGFGNLFSHVGKIHNYYPSDFFYPDMIVTELLNNNGLVFYGGVAGYLFSFLSRFIMKMIKS